MDQLDHDKVDKIVIIAFSLTKIKKHFWMHFARWNFNNKIVATTKKNNFPTQGNT